MNYDYWILTHHQPHLVLLIRARNNFVTLYLICLKRMVVASKFFET